MQSREHILPLSPAQWELPAELGRSREHQHARFGLSLPQIFTSLCYAGSAAPEVHSNALLAERRTKL